MNGSPWDPDPAAVYGSHLDNVLRWLSIDWGDHYFDFRFVVYHHPVYSPLPEFTLKGPSTILIFLSDEESTIPKSLCKQFFAILKTYWPLENPLQNIISFPIGYSNYASNAEFIPFEKRCYRATFAGNFLSNRLDFYRQFTRLKSCPPWPIDSIYLRKAYWHFLTRTKLFKPCEFGDWLPQTKIYFSDGFAKGLPREEYARIIANTQIALCPKGYISTECFRLFETMKLGCVIVADELPPSPWYKNSPIIIEKNWHGIRKLVRELAESPDVLMRIHRETLAWWEKTCCDASAARYLAANLEALKD